MSPTDIGVAVAGFVIGYLARGAYGARRSRGPRPAAPRQPYPAWPVVMFALLLAVAVAMLTYGALTADAFVVLSSGLAALAWAGMLGRALGLYRDGAP